MFSLHRRSFCRISSLPNELLHEIATYLAIRNDVKDFVNDNRDVASFSMVSRRIRSIALPLLFHEIALTSKSQLEALSQVPKDLLAEVRVLNIFMDSEFIDAWKLPSLSYALIHILSQTPALHALRVLVAELTGQSSAWSRFSLGRTRGLPIGHAIHQSVMMFPRFNLPHLRILEVDALDDIESLTLLAPNLEILRMNKSCGYEVDANTRLVSTLTNLPNIRELAYSPESLRISEATSVQEELEVEDADDNTKKDDGCVRLLRAIALAAPSLETLNLQTRWYGEDIRFLESSEPVSAGALKEALAALTRLKNVALPSTVSSVQDHKIINASPSDGVSLAASLSNITTSERAIAAELGSANLNLKSISFIRPVSSSNSPFPPTQCSVTYDVSSTPERTIFMGYNATPIIRPSVTEVYRDVSVKSAEDDQVDARTKTVKGVSFERVWHRLIDGRRVTMTVIIAGAGAIVASEAGKLIASW